MSKTFEDDVVDVCFKRSTGALLLFGLSTIMQYASNEQNGPGLATEMLKTARKMYPSGTEEQHESLAMMLVDACCQLVVQLDNFHKGKQQGPKEVPDFPHGKADPFSVN